VRRALIGHTGFVGSSLSAAGGYTDFYNSRNIGAIAGGHFDEIVCAGISAVKWLANREPEKDWQGIDALLQPLSAAKADRFTLISTIDVYPDPAAQTDEDFDPSGPPNHPYGQHRLAVEKFVTERFGRVLIARLPALFGAGLKKNLLFDLLTGNDIGKINPSSSFQWYPLHRLANDIETARTASLDIVNLFPEPVATSDILARNFPDAHTAAPSEPAPHYDLRTRHAALFGGQNGYIASRQSVLEDIGSFVKAARTTPALLDR
jgi:hypothetical protein